MSGERGTTLVIDHVSVARGSRTVINEVSITVVPGEVTALLGPNGAGKSSLVLAIGGVLKPTAGRVTFGEHELAGARPEFIRASGVAVVPEGRRLLPNMTVQENLEIGTYTMRPGPAKEGIAYAMELFPELQKHWTSPAKLLSGGEQQMVVLGQALASRPRILVIDELSLGLAPVIVKRLASTLRDVVQTGTGILLIEQFAHVALSVSTAAYILGGGRIVYSGTAAELSANNDMMTSSYLLAGAVAGDESRERETT